MQTDNNIKEVFTKLIPENKDSVRKQISDAYCVSPDSVKNSWIYGGQIPEKNAEGVKNIVRSVAQKQINELKKLLDCI